VTLFLCGDVMTGRGVDQILGTPSDPQLHESSLDDARDYVALAERMNGAVGRRVEPVYVWGDALEELAHAQPDARIVNLETAITRSNDWAEGKGIHYRMHPENVTCLAAAGIDVACLANNHVLDWGVDGLLDTLSALHSADILAAGAGVDRLAAEAPARLGHLLVFACGSETAGVPRSWGATDTQAGVALVDELSAGAAERIVARLRAHKREGDVAVVSLHWGDNWGYEVPEAFVRFAHALVDGGADLVHGHSSHHPRPIELYRGRLILYGCGDFIDDYEGIEGLSPFRNDLVLMYLATLDAAGALEALKLVPLQKHKLRLRRASSSDARTLAQTLSRISARFDLSIDRDHDNTLVAHALREGRSHTLG
jgi:poly-gamma-glutamate synthesis protein (capsule biosynthesis protein)